MYDTISYDHVPNDKKTGRLKNYSSGPLVLKKSVFMKFLPKVRVHKLLAQKEYMCSLKSTVGNPWIIEERFYTAEIGNIVCDLG